jgi:hypothetical protein
MSISLGVRNVISGWLGIAIPTPARQRNRTRASYRKTRRRSSVPHLIRRLEAAGCQPRQVGDGVWFALCPACLSEDRRSTIEIRRTDQGLIMACADAHEPRLVR